MFGYIYLGVLFMLLVAIPILIGYESTRSIHAQPKKPSNDDIMTYFLCSIFWPLVLVFFTCAGFIWFIEDILLRGFASIGRGLFNIGVKIAKRRI